MKAALKGKYDYDSTKGLTPSAASNFAFLAGDIKLRASITDATVAKGPSLAGLSLGVEKPGFFIVDYNVPKKDFRFQFMSSARVLEKRLKMTYIHSKNDNRTMVDGTLVLDPANKVSVNHTLGSKNGMFKYTYVHGGGLSFEPRYDLGRNAWDFGVSRKLFGDDVVRASYHTSNNVLGLEWARNSKTHGCFKVTDVLGESKQKRSRSGYNENIALVRKVSSAADFVWSDKPLELLGTATSISFGDPDSLRIKDHDLTTEKGD